MQTFDDMPGWRPSAGPGIMTDECVLLDPKYGYSRMRLVDCQYDCFLSRVCSIVIVRLCADISFASKA
jgi:hypothetical protein